MSASDETSGEQLPRGGIWPALRPGTSAHPETAAADETSDDVDNNNSSEGASSNERVVITLHIHKTGEDLDITVDKGDDNILDAIVRHVYGMSVSGMGVHAKLGDQPITAEDTFQDCGIEHDAIITVLNCAISNTQMSITAGDPTLEDIRQLSPYTKNMDLWPRHQPQEYWDALKTLIIYTSPGYNITSPEHNIPLHNIHVQFGFRQFAFRKPKPKSQPKPAGKVRVQVLNATGLDSHDHVLDVPSFPTSGINAVMLMLLVLTESWPKLRQSIPQELCSLGVPDMLVRRAKLYRTVDVGKVDKVAIRWDEFIEDRTGDYSIHLDCTLGLTMPESSRTNIFWLRREAEERFDSGYFSHVNVNLGRELSEAQNPFEVDWHNIRAVFIRSCMYRKLNMSQPGFFSLFSWIVPNWEWETVRQPHLELKITLYTDVRKCVQDYETEWMDNMKWNKRCEATEKQNPNNHPLLHAEKQLGYIPDMIIFHNQLGDNDFHEAGNLRGNFHEICPFASGSYKIMSGDCRFREACLDRMQAYFGTSCTLHFNESYADSKIAEYED